MIQHFLASLTTPSNDLWVNLSPYEGGRVIPDQFGQTLMGRDLLAQDYILKQISASLTDPGTALGKKFWDRVYASAKEHYGTMDVPLETFNKVWIVPESADVVVKGNVVVVAKASLKLMLEKDYLAASRHAQAQQGKVALVPRGGKQKKAGDPSAALRLQDDGASPQDDISSRIMREVILPELEREVNEDKNFASIRQIYNALILATWMKEKLMKSAKNGQGNVLGRIYIDQNKVLGVDHGEADAAKHIWQRYVDAFKKGVVNLIKEEADPETGEILPRKYFSGGADMVNLAMKVREVEDNVSISGTMIAARLVSARRLHVEAGRRDQANKRKLGMGSLQRNIRQLQNGGDHKISEALSGLGTVRSENINVDVSLFAQGLAAFLQGVVGTLERQQKDPRHTQAFIEKTIHRFKAILKKRTYRTPNISTQEKLSSAQMELALLTTITFGYLEPASDKFKNFGAGYDVMAAFARLLLAFEGHEGEAAVRAGAVQQIKKAIAFLRDIKPGQVYVLKHKRFDAWFVAPSRASDVHDAVREMTEPMKDLVRGVLGRVSKADQILNEIKDMHTLPLEEDMKILFDIEKKLAAAFSDHESNDPALNEFNAALRRLLFTGHMEIKNKAIIGNEYNLRDLLPAAAITVEMLRLIPTQTWEKNKTRIAQVHQQLNMYVLPLLRGLLTAEKVGYYQYNEAAIPARTEDGRLSSPVLDPNHVFVPQNSVFRAAVGELMQEMQTILRATRRAGANPQAAIGAIYDWRGFSQATGSDPAKDKLANSLVKIKAADPRLGDALNITFGKFGALVRERTGRSYGDSDAIAQRLDMYNLTSGLMIVHGLGAVKKEDWESASMRISKALDVLKSLLNAEVVELVPYKTNNAGEAGEFINWQELLSQEAVSMPADENKENAMAAPGGVDLNPSRLKLNVSEGSPSPEYNAAMSTLTADSIDGLRPVILGISTIGSLQELVSTP
ncbi:MAG: hypothetical protein HQL19_05770 [Candidatus Omnitrophica bacterium]|nr:hypothetical protein [Candidatus Omnitrophota bacterium]